MCGRRDHGLGNESARTPLPRDPPPWTSSKKRMHVWHTFTHFHNLCAPNISPLPFCA
jgi:hypothetical protein